MRSYCRSAAESAVQGELWRVPIDDDGLLDAAVAAGSDVRTGGTDLVANCRGNSPGSATTAFAAIGMHTLPGKWPDASRWQCLG